MAGSSYLDDLMNALAGRGYIDGSSWLQKPQAQPDGPPKPVQNNTGASAPTMATISPQQYQQELAMAQNNMQPSPQNVPPIQRPMMGAAPALPQGFQPANLGHVPNIPQIQQPIQGSVPALGQGFSRLPTLLDLLLNRRA